MPGLYRGTIWVKTITCKTCKCETQAVMEAFGNPSFEDEEVEMCDSCKFHLNKKKNKGVIA